MNDEEFGRFDFTERNWDRLYDTVDSKDFKDKDSDMIYHLLSEELNRISFGEYLKRYIYIKARLYELDKEISLNDYQLIIKNSFKENNTPSSFEPTTAKISSLSKNWLTQKTVKRKVVFLLGFGLRMSASDVNDFLTKALKEHQIDPKDPFEVICWYCYKNSFSYLKFEKLWEKYIEKSKMPSTYDTISTISSDMTIGVRNTMHNINSDEELLAFVSRLDKDRITSKRSISARKSFDTLFNESRKLAAKLYNIHETEQHNKEISEYRDKLINSERISDEELFSRVERKKKQKKIYTADDMTETDLEHIISSAIPVDRHGNLIPIRSSTLNAPFDGKRFSRQRISDIISGSIEVTRFDLITLNFFIFSQKLDEYPDNKIRFMEFIDSTNNILQSSSFRELYISDPYECFVLMCIVSDDPLATYADVWEMSYKR